jgi:steroid 5-alpha reductase family enzyme
MSFSIYAMGLLAILVLTTFTWSVSVMKRDVSIVDGMWPIMFLVAALVYSGKVDLYTPRSSLILTLVLLWALRLSLHIIVRNWGEPEDRRYRDIREKYEPNFALKSLGIIFIFQGLLAWIISMPLWGALTVPVEIGPIDVFAIALWTVGMTFEVVGDWQLARFQSDPANRGEVLDTGLWRFTRHPNYFGECVIWWGFYIFAIPVGGWWTIIAPLLLTYMLLKFSGVSLLEETIVARRPAYQEYIERTNAFIPGRPQKIQNTTKSHERAS